MRTLIERCQEISAAAERIRAFAARFTAPRRWRERSAGFEPAGVGCGWIDLAVTKPDRLEACPTLLSPLPPRSICRRAIVGAPRFFRARTRSRRESWPGLATHPDVSADSAIAAPVPARPHGIRALETLCAAGSFSPPRACIRGDGRHRPRPRRTY